MRAMVQLLLFLQPFFVLLLTYKTSHILQQPGLARTLATRRRPRRSDAHRGYGRGRCRHGDRIQPRQSAVLNPKYEYRNSKDRNSKRNTPEPGACFEFWILIFVFVSYLLRQSLRSCRDSYFEIRISIFGFNHAAPPRPPCAYQT